MSTNTNAQPTTYPEHEKLAALDGLNDRIGEFIEWMRDQKRWSICQWVEAGNNGEARYRWKEERIGKKRRANSRHTISEDDEPDTVDEYNGDAERNPAFESWGEGYTPIRAGIPLILAEYFGIDQDKLEAEKRAMLDEIRKSQRAAAEVR